MKLKYKMEYMDLGDEIVVVPTDEKAMDFHGIIKVNDTAKIILEHLEKDTSIDEIVNSISKDYEESSKSEIKDYVEKFVEQLNQYELLD